VGTDDGIIIKGAIGNIIADGSYTGIQTTELPHSLDKYKFLYFKGSFETANESYPNVYVKFGFKGDKQDDFNYIKTEFNHNLNNTEYVKETAATEDGYKYYQITFPN
jgi:hypothetical protein